MRRALFLVMFIAGCHPITIVTDDAVRMDAPVVMKGKLSLETTPVSYGGPVREMTLNGTDGCDNGPKIAVVDVDGLLLNSDLAGPYSVGDNPVAMFREKLDAIAADSAVGAVVVRINSPGGGVTASDIMWRDLHAFRAATHKPAIACLMDLGCGGAYYLATAADLIVAHPTTVTGGVGVILNLYNLDQTMEYFNVHPQPIKAGEHIDMGSPLRKLPEDAEKLLQAMADEYHQRFRQVVVNARPAVNADETNFDGRVFTAAQALQRRFIDRIGYLDDAIALAKTKAGLNEARVVLFHRCNDPAQSQYAITPNVPLHTSLIPISVPGLDRSRLPTFLYLWQAEATLDKLGGK
jgi:protease-4